MSTERFKALMEEMRPYGWTVRRVAALLGMDQRQVARYKSGDQDVPLTVSKALRYERIRELFYVPLLGRVPAGPLSLAIEDAQDFVEVKQKRLPGEVRFALRVDGDSMTGDDIEPGDIVIVRQQPSADDGDLVVARVGDEATLKELRRTNGRVELHPANENYEVIVPDGDVEVLGKVTEVRKRFE